MQLNEFDISELDRMPDCQTKEGFLRMVIVGPSDSGKTFLFKHLANKIFINQYDVVICFCGSVDTRREYQQLFNTKFVYEAYNPEIINRIKAHQEETAKTNKKRHPVARILIVYDDFANRGTTHNKELFELAISGRHDCISFVMILHDLACLDRIVRDNLTHMIIARQQAAAVYETVAREYLYMAFAVENQDRSTRDIMKHIMTTLHDNTGGYYFIVVNLIAMKKNTNAKIKDYLTKYKAN